MRRWLLVIALAACHRTVEEPTPSHTATTSASATKDERCVVKTPAEAPPAVAPVPSSACPVDPQPGSLPTVTVRFPEATSGEARVTSELARSTRDSARGLMYRTSLGDDAGMLFDLGEPKVPHFWMRNTCIPLDMIFLGDDGFIAGILENVPPMNEAQRTIPCEVSYVLEVNAGWSRKHGVRAGQRAALPGA